MQQSEEIDLNWNIHFWDGKGQMSLTTTFDLKFMGCSHKVHQMKDNFMDYNVV